MTKVDLFELLFSSDVKAQEQAMSLIELELEKDRPNIDLPALVTFSFARPYLKFRDIVYDRLETLRKEGRSPGGGHDGLLSLIYELHPLQEKARCLIELLPNRPKKLDYREQLEYIKYVCEKGDVRTIKKLIELTSFDNGESLCWHGSRVKKIPEEFSSFPKLKNVEFYTAYLKSFPGVLCKISDLEELKIYSSKIASLPKEIKLLKKLRKLSIIRNVLEFIPDEISELSNLEELDLTKNRLTELPVSMAKLTKLKKVILVDNPMTAATQVKKLFSFFYEESTPLLTKQVWLHLIFARLEEAIELNSIIDIIAAFNTTIPLLKDSAMLALDKLSAQQLAAKPLTSESIIGVVGRVEDLELMTESLSEHNIKLKTKFDEECTHLFVGESPELAESSDTAILTVNTLGNFLLGDEVPLFLDQTEDSDNAQERVADLLLSEDEKNQLIAFEMLKSLGVSQNVAANLYFLFRTTGNKKIRTTAKSLLLRNASPAFVQIINKNQSYTNCSEPGVKRYLAGISTISDIDVIYFAQLIYKKMGFAVNFLFDTKDASIISQVLEDNIKHHGYLDLRYSHLTYLPEEIGQFVQLEKIDLDGNKLEGLPESIGQLENLKEIRLRDNKISGLPESFSNLKKLHSLDVQLNKFKSFPVELLQLTKLKTLNLCSNKIKKWPKSLKCFNNLTHLSYGDGIAMEIPSCFFTLPSLESLVIYHANLKSIQPEIANLRNLKSLELTLCELRQFPIAVCELENLEELSLNSNDIQEYPDNVANLSKLKHLNIRSNNLKNLPTNITKITSLEQLDLLHNDIHDYPESLENLANLKKIRLSGFIYGDEALRIRDQVSKLVPKNCVIER